MLNVSYIIEEILLIFKTEMADSDDEYDRRKGREKFRRERNDYERREERRGRDPRDPWDRER